jgi:hypothetical protein
MGCLKLHTENIYTGLKVVYGGLYESKKSVQRFLNVDPLAHTQPGWSPYKAFLCNPIFWTDPTGATESPIYDQESGDLLGTDDQGLQGDAIVMDKSKFTQGMKHDDAVAAGSSLSNAPVNGEVYDKIAKIHSSLPSRPDYHGYMNIDEMIKWGKDHPQKVNGVPDPENAVYLDASKYNWAGVWLGDFSKVGEAQNLNLGYPQRMVYANSETVHAWGGCRVTLMSSDGIEGQIRVSQDIFDYDQKSFSSGFKQSTPYGFYNAIIRRTEIGLLKMRYSIPETNYGFYLRTYGTGTIYKFYNPSFDADNAGFD